jgi:hypothetical protein
MIDQPQGEKSALVVVIQSWWTPALAVIMLVVGLLAGYFGRPLINNGSASDGASQVTQEGVAAINPAATATATVDPAQIQEFMSSIIAQTTNFQGDPNATVTLIEFSDYQ